MKEKSEKVNLFICRRTIGSMYLNEWKRIRSCEYNPNTNRVEDGRPLGVLGCDRG
jgi:hypothetical protein